ncbi:MAG: cation diffusion facilitator family transporter [Acidobacteria bacterium]|nr:cation diffusion facilitator family transporter [Acidobacteriota bacterium]
MKAKTNVLELSLPEKHAVALHSVLTAIFLTGLKLTVGWLSGSLGILSEAANSGLDVLAAVLIYWSVWISDKPADSDHQYGHQKIENFSAFLQIGLVLATGLLIVSAALQRLFFTPVQVQLSVWAFAVMILSMIVSFFRVRELRRAAQKYRSQALESHALNYHLDIWSAFVVLIGLGALWAGDRLRLPALRVADPLAALAVATLILYHSVQLGRQAVNALLDAAPLGLRGRIIEAVKQVNGVVRCERVRVRHAGSKFFVDMKLTVQRTIPFDHVPEILEAVRNRIGKFLPDADIVVHTEPNEPGEDNLFEKVKWIAGRNNLAVHDLLFHEVDGQLTLDLHLEVNEELTLDQAHAQANCLESKIFEGLPEIAAINTHIEGEGTHIETGKMAAELRMRMVEELKKIATQVPDILDCHDLTIREINDKTYVSCHVLMDGVLPITRVHDRTVELESLFKKAFPAIHKVTIHTEPESERGVSGRPLRSATSRNH